jgi:hypothetical protein
MRRLKTWMVQQDVGRGDAPYAIFEVGNRGAQSFAIKLCKMLELRKVKKTGLDTHERCSN